jgi:lipoprotein signal peptidase
VIPSLIYGTSFLRQSIPVWVGYLPFLVASKESIRPFLFRDIYNLADSYYPLGIALLLWYLFYKKLRDQPLKV